MNAPLTSLLSRYTEREWLASILLKAIHDNMPIALWRLPGSDTKYLIIADQYRKVNKQSMLEDLEPGFIMAPFDPKSERLFLPGDRMFVFENGELRTEEHSLNGQSRQFLAQIPKTSAPASRLRFVTATKKNSDPGKDHFVKMVREALNNIEGRVFEKVVPSRIKVTSLPEDFDVIESFNTLCARHPEALVSFVSIPSEGAWLGASPEVLVCVEDKKIFRTVALAGTLPLKPGTDIRSVAWTQKEIEEQALVERYVISCFKKIRLREYDEHGPRTVVAGNLIHLKSEFTVDMVSTGFPQLGSVMLNLLHPTSAVCGMPLESAFAFLKDHEGYDREYYAGFLGPVNVNNNIDLFVNLRCMQLAGDKAIFYAGAGVTAESIPENEWEETEIKINTLFNAIL